MSAPDPIDNYFTRNIVGTAMLVEMGPGDSVRNLPERGQWLEAGRQRARLAGIALASLAGRDPHDSQLGEPVSARRLSRVRWQVGLLVLLAWSGLLWALFSYTHR
jgi:hypothetical protein